MSDQDSSIFNSSETPTQESTSVQPDDKSADAPLTDPYADLLKGIQSEDGRQKYQSVQDAINSIPHAQKHISSLEQELKQAREERERLASELEKKSQMDEALSRIATPEEGSKPSAQLDEKQLVGLVEQVLGRQQQQTVEKGNITSVVNTLTNKFGNAQAADKAYREKAQELGIGVEMLNDIAKRSPTAVYAYFGIQQGASAPAKTNSGSINTASLGQNPTATQRATNPLLTGSMKDMQAEWNRIKQTIDKSN